VVAVSVDSHQEVCHFTAKSRFLTAEAVRNDKVSGPARIAAAFT